MRILCDACGAKYSIADDRVAGKVFKIRCKKCSTIIVVKGAPPEPVQEEPGPAPAGDWHLAIEGAQSGPFEAAELQRRHAAGELDDATLVWREGMDEWAAFGSVSELVQGTSTSAREDLFAPTPSTRSGVFADEPAVKLDDKKLLAERNESSVLFTLGNLAKLASSTPVPAASKDAAKDAAKAGSGEGSGLIDIRALASTFAPRPGAARPATASVGSLDDLPTFGPAGFGEPIVLMPTAGARPDRKMIYALFAALAMLVIVGAILLVIVLRDDKRPEVAIDQPATRVASLSPSDPRARERSTAAAATTEVTTTTNPTAGTRSTTAGSTTSSTTSSATTGSTTGSATHPSTTSRPRPSTSRPATTTSPSVTASRPASTTASTSRPTPATTAPPAAKPDRVQCEFSNYADKGCELYKPAVTTVTSSNLPENLDRAAIAAGLGTIKAQGCGSKSDKRGDVSVQIKINAAGGVIGVTVKSSPDPALSACVVAAAQKGMFAKTQRGQSFGYVWRF